MNTTFAWHVHHEILLEPLTEDIEVRRTYINEYKPESERALRLRLLSPVKGPLPKTYHKAKEAYNKAEEAYNKAWEAYNKAWEAFVKAKEAYNKAGEDCGAEIEALHAQECTDCPWNGQTIFPSKD